MKRALEHNEEELVEIKLKLQKKLILSNVKKYPFIKDNSITFIRTPMSDLYEALDSPYTTKMDTLVEDNKINALVDDLLHELDAAEEYSSYPLDDPDQGYEWSNLDGAYELYLHAPNNELTIDEGYDLAPFVVYVVTLPIYHK